MLGPWFSFLVALLLRHALGDLSLKDVKATTSFVVDDPSGLLIEACNVEDSNNLGEELGSEGIKKIKILTGSLSTKWNNGCENVCTFHKRGDKLESNNLSNDASMPAMFIAPQTVVRSDLTRISRETPMLVYHDVPFEATYGGNSNVPIIVTMSPLDSKPLSHPRPVSISDELKPANVELPDKPISMTIVLENLFPKWTNYAVQNTSEVSEEGKLTLKFQLLKQEENKVSMKQNLSPVNQDWKYNPINYNILQAHKDRERLDKLGSVVRPSSVQSMKATHGDLNHLTVGAHALGSSNGFGKLGGRTKSTNSIRFFPFSSKSSTTKSSVGALRELGAVLRNEGDIERIDKNRLRNLLVKSALSLINQDVLQDNKLTSR